MKSNSFFIALILGHLFPAVLLGSPFEVLQAEPEGVYKIDPSDPEITIDDQYVKRITLGKKTGSILFFNKTTENFTPRMTIYILDKYGIPISVAMEYWIIGSVAAGEPKTHETSFRESDIKKQLQYSTLEFPDDGGEPFYLAIDYGP